MKWLILLAALMLAGTAFANPILNPSFESTQSDSSGGRLNPNNLTIPLDWFTGLDPTEDQSNWGSLNGNGTVNTTSAFDGSNSFEGIGTGGNGAQITSSWINITNLAFPIRLVIYEKSASVYDTLDMEFYSTSGSHDAEYNGSSFSESTAYCNFDECAADDAGNGWTKLSFILNANDFVEDSVQLILYPQTGVLLDNVSLASYDIVTPVVSISSPSGSVASPFDVNYTASDISLDSCWYSVDSGSNTSIPFCSNFTDQASTGIHNITVYANDTSGNVGSDDSSFYISAPTPPASGMTGATGVTVNAVIIVFLLTMVIAGFGLMLGAKGDIQLVIAGFIIMLMGIIFASIMFAAVNA